MIPLPTLHVALSNCMKHISIGIIALLCLLFSCKQDDLVAPVPAFLKIENINVKQTATVQGSFRDNITDAWVFVNDQLIGSFELPTIIPIQKTGAINIKIRGGINNSGMSNDRKIYPFYDFFELDTVVSPEEEINLTPVVPYRTIAVYDHPWSGEDFESGVNFIKNSNSQTTLDRNTTDQVYEGNASGIAELDFHETFFEVYTPPFSDIPTIGTPVYMEMDYKCSHDLVISIYTDNFSRQNGVIVLRPKETWNKVYIDFTNVFSTLSLANNYNIAIGMQKGTDSRGAVHLDNVKLIHY